VLNEAPRHEDVLGVEIQRHALLTSALEGGDYIYGCIEKNWKT